MATKLWYPIADTATKEIELTVPDDAANHYSLVDDPAGSNDGTNTEVYFQADGPLTETDIYTITSTDPVPAGATNISVKVYIALAGSGTGSSGYAALKVGSTVYYGAEHLVGSYTAVSDTWATNPAGGAWTVAAVNAISIGVKLSIPVVGGSRCTQVYAEITYTPAVTTRTMIRPMSMQQMLADLTGYSNVLSEQEIVNIYLGYGKTKYTWEEAMNIKAGLGRNARPLQLSLYTNLKTLLSLSCPYTKYTPQEYLYMAYEAGLTMDNVLGI